jgi:hypothetical protein
MTKLLDDVIAQVRALPEREQDAAAGVLLDYLGTNQDARSTRDQIAEARRRRADPTRRAISFDEARRKLEAE